MNHIELNNIPPEIAGLFKSSPDVEQLISQFMKSKNHQILNLKSYQSKRSIKKKILAFLENPEQTLKIREPVQIDRHHYISVQASSIHYSFPRDDRGHYSHVEIGMPSFQLSKTFMKTYGLRDRISTHLPLPALFKELAGQMFKFKQLKLGKIASMDKPKRTPKAKSKPKTSPTAQV